MSSDHANRSLPSFLTTERTHVLALAFAGLLAKLAIFRDVAVNGDTGLYIYDAMQILQGRAILVEFPSRSPLFEYLLAAAVATGDVLGVAPLPSVRAFMIAISVALGVAIYALALELFDHRVGLVAAALFYVTPFSLVWGVWVKTEQAATLLAIVGFLVALRYIDRDDVPYHAMATVGALFGLAFLIRRTAIVHAGAFGFFYLWYRHRYASDSLTHLLTRAATTAVAAVGTTAVAYALLALAAGGGPRLAWAIADAHALALFSSSGQGSLGWIHTPTAPTAYVESRDGLLWQICQKCGDNTALVFTTTAFVTLPVAILALVPIRSRLRRFDALTADYIAPAVLIGPLVYAAFRTVVGREFLAALLAALGVFAVWFSRPIDWRRYWRPTAMLPVATFAALAAGYLYRDRIMYVTYFQDLFPFLVVLAAAGGVAWAGANRQTTMRVFLAVVLASSGVAAGMHAYPLTESADDSAHWFTVEGVDAYGADIDSRTDPGAWVFTAQPLYVVHSDAKPLADLSRQYYLFRGWPDSPEATALEAEIVAALEAGDAPYAIADANLEEITSVSPAIEGALGRNYCSVHAPIYDRTDATLLAHESTGECA